MDEKTIQKLNALDKKIVALFELRMAIVEKAAAGMTKRTIAQQARQIGKLAAKKATSYACDVSTIAYTEELIKLMLCASCRYQRRLLMRREDACKYSYNFV